LSLLSTMLPHSYNVLSPLSLHDALPIWADPARSDRRAGPRPPAGWGRGGRRGGRRRTIRGGGGGAVPARVGTPGQAPRRTTPSSTVTEISGRWVVAGPASTSPLAASKREPWQGQSSSISSWRSAQPLWVQYPE